MYALFEDAGKFLAGRVMSEADSSMQIELDSGKRVKVKAANVLLKFEKPAPAELIATAHHLSQDIDLDLAWEFAPEREFGFADLAREYFDANADTTKQAAALFRLFEAPLDLLTAAGAIDSPYQFHWRRFLFENFPRGTGFPPLAPPAIKEALPLAAVQAFSIDDSATTEIDDALSVQGLGTGRVTFGVH